MLTIDLRDRVALVLGGSRGIGAGIVEALCQGGARVVFTYRDDPKYQPQTDALVAGIRDRGGFAEAIAADACDAARTEQIARSMVEQHGKIDHLVCVVGQTLKRPVEKVTNEDWHRFIDINLSTAFYGIRAVVPHMVKAGYGRIVLIGSSVVYDGGGGAIDYVAGKAGLAGMMTYMTRTYARKGILTNVIHPCVVDTDLLRERYDTPELRARLIEQVPVGRLGTPADIGQLAAYLLSPLGDFICNQAILVDGGRTMF